MARRVRRSRPIQAFTQNLMAGLQLGLAHADRKEAIAARRDAVAAQLQKNAQQAEFNKAKLGIEGMKAGAYAELSAANARKADRWQPSGGGGGSKPINPATAAVLAAHGVGPDYEQPAVPRTTQTETDTPVPPPPASGDSGGSGLADTDATLYQAKGGKVPALRRGGRPRPGVADTFNTGMTGTMRALDYQDRVNQRRLQSPADAAKTAPTTPTITRTSSTQSRPFGDPSAPQLPAAAPEGGYGYGYEDGGVVRGMYTPGGFGTPAAPPASAGPRYRNGGAVQRMQAGGAPSPDYAGGNLITQMATAMGAGWWNRRQAKRAAVAATLPVQAPGPTDLERQRVNEYWRANTPAHGRTTSEQVGPGGGADVDPYYGGRGVVRPAPPAEPDDTVGNQGETGEFPDTAAAPAAPRGGGNGRGGQIPWMKLGDQRRQAAYDPTKDAADPRNLAIIDEQGAVMEGTYGMKPASGFQMLRPDQQTFRQGGVVRAAGGGRLPVPYQRGFTPMPPTGGRGHAAQQPGAMPPQGGGEPMDEGQAMADELTAMWRDEAYATAELNQQGPTRPMAHDEGAGGPNQSYAPMPGPSDQAGGGPMAQQSPLQIPELPERDPQWARDIRATQPMLEIGSANETGTGVPPPPPYPEPDEAAGSPRAGYAPPTRPGAHDEGAGTPGQRYTPPPFAGEEARADERGRPRFEGETDFPRQDEPTRPTAHDEGAGSPLQTSKPAAGAPARGAAPASPSGPSAGQIEADRLTEEYRNRGQARPAAPGAIAAKPPMLQGVTDPEGGRGLASPGPDIGTGNAARDYIAGAQTFAKWAMKDAGPQRADEAQASLYSGKGAAQPDEVAAVFMAVDPDNKMPLDKRVEAAAKAAHDFHVANGDPKAASEAAFSIVQFGVAKSREHGASAVKAVQAGDEKAALKELMAGYSWLADRGTARLDGQNIVVTGEDGKVRAQIPLQPGTVQNLALGMMSGQLAWDAIERASAPASAQPAPQAVTTAYPAAGNAPPPAASPPQRPSAPSAQPSAAPAGPAAPPAAINTTPPNAKPATPPQSGAQAPASRPPASPANPSKPAAGGQKSSAYPVVDLDKLAADTKARMEARDGKTTTPTPTTASTSGGPKTEEPKKPTKPGEGDPDKEHFAKNPYEPPPGATQRRGGRGQADMANIEKAIKANQQRMNAAIAEFDADAVKAGMPKDDYNRYRQKIIAKYKAEHDHIRGRIEKEIDRVRQREDAQEQRELNKEPRKVSSRDEAEFEEAFNKRAQYIGMAEGMNPAETAKKKAALDRGILPYMPTADRRQEMNDLARVVWQHNDTSKDKALDAVIGMTDIYKEGVGMNLRTGKEAAAFRPLSKTTQGHYVVQMPSGEEVTIPATAYKRILAMKDLNWRSQMTTEGKAEREAILQEKARKGLLNRAGKALLYTNPFTVGPMLGIDIGAAIAGDRSGR